MNDVFDLSVLHAAIAQLDKRFEMYAIYITQKQAAQIEKAVFQAEEDHKLALWLRGRPYHDFDLGLAVMRHERRREDRHMRGPVTAADVIARVQKLRR